MSLGSEFKAFLQRGNVLDLAVAVVIGGAFGKIVNALVEDLVMPIVGVVTPGGDWRNLTATPLDLKVGHLLGVSLDFVLVALVVFLAVVKVGGKLKLTGAPPATVAPATKICGECQTEIPVAARRCRACREPIRIG